MDPTIVAFPRQGGEPGRHALVLLDAARAWRRCPVHDDVISDAPGPVVPFPDVTVRRMGAAGLLNALAPLDGMMLVIAAHADEPLDLGRPGEPPREPDARLMAWVLDAALAGEISEDAVDRLALRIDIGARALLRAALRRLAGAMQPRVERGVWPLSATRCPPDHDLDAAPVPDPVSLLAAE
ncbi:hypothetical protein [Rhodospira trueperi]|uniref:Uncharacterized protein n=1 Tax=Rhodospira trueperi TaxID=69960 RepID=A0A1G7GDQ7_9PROT|nr:hypothetical protein [Rhodospira trueperi]SDE86288.1 hypothetical protein SAMN05421720_11453 [Rhodospira trueperi]